MKLEQYLQLTQQSDEAFGKLIGLEKSTIWRIRKGKVFPSWATMLRIKAATHGAVEPNDFEPVEKQEAE
jgi:DNA-binding XRE family transcriptional regulator